MPWLIRDYRSDKNRLIPNASSVVEALDVKNAAISNLVNDGNRENNFFADGCNSAGILILRSENVEVDNVHVKDTEVLFEGNHVFENKSDGIHLRGERESNESPRNTFRKNVIENNGTESRFNSKIGKQQIRQTRIG